MKSASQKRLGLTLGLVSAVCYSTRTPLVKFGLNAGAGVRELAALRMVFTALLFLAAGLFTRRDPKDAVRLTAEWRAWVGALCFTASVFASFFAVSLIGVALTVVLVYTHPAFVALLTRIFHGEKMGRGRALAYLAAYAGCGLVIWPGISEVGAGKMAPGAAAALLAAFTYAAYQTLTQTLTARVSSLRLGAFTAYVSVLPSLLLWRFSPPTVPAPALGYLALMAVFATFIPMYLVIASIKLVGAATSSLLALTSPVAALAMAAAFFGEKLHGLQWAGAALVIVSIALTFVAGKD